MFLTCAEVGAHLAGADEDTIHCMHDWGLALGLCFQLMDDLIDVLSDSDTLGKPSGSDVAQGKTNTNGNPRIRATTITIQG